MKKLYSLLIILFCYQMFSQKTEDKVSPFLDAIIFQFPNVRDLAISQDGDEAVFSAQSVMGDLSALIYVKKENNQWNHPEVISFSGRYFDIEPYFSKDGLTLYFVSNRPLDQISDEIKDFDIWYVTRQSKKDQWSKPTNIGAPINTEMDEFYPSIVDSKNLYFTLDNPTLNQKDDIYVSEYKNGKYTQPKRLGEGINSNGYEFNAFVSSDESYLIYTCYNREGGYGSGDLYISHNSGNCEWSPSQNMGKRINSDKMDYCPFVDEATNTLYFTSKRNSLNPTFSSKVNLEELIETFNSYENGLSRLYRVILKEE